MIDCRASGSKTSGVDAEAEICIGQNSTAVVVTGGMKITVVSVTMLPPLMLHTGI